MDLEVIPVGRRSLVLPWLAALLIAAADRLPGRPAVPPLGAQMPPGSAPSGGSSEGAPAMAAA